MSSYRIGFIKLPLMNPGVPFRVSLPGDCQRLDVFPGKDSRVLHFGYNPVATKVTRLASGVALFTPSEIHTFLWLIPGVTYEGEVGVFIKSFEGPKGVEHLFDLTRYNHRTGKVL